MPPTNPQNPLVPPPPHLPFPQGLLLKVGELAVGLAATRHYITRDPADGSLAYDPRFLVFEFACNLLLREPQVGGGAVADSSNLLLHEPQVCVCVWGGSWGDVEGSSGTCCCASPSRGGQ